MFVATISENDLDATARVLLVDVSSASYPHGKAVSLVSIKRTWARMEKAGAGGWRAKVGVVEGVDATKGTVRFLAIVPLMDQTDGEWFFDFSKGCERGLSSRVGGIRSNLDDIDSTNWQNDINFKDALGNTDAKIAAGDVVVEIEEVDGTATCSYSVGIEYGYIAQR